MKEKLREVRYRMENGIRNYMAGRNGADDLARFVLGVTLVCLLASLFVRWLPIYLAGLLSLSYGYFRTLSRNIPKRYQENQKYLTLKNRVLSKWRLSRKHMAERKTHRFFKCPQCGQKVRVPKGRGKICIICPKCRTEFTKKS